MLASRRELVELRDHALRRCQRKGRDRGSIGQQLLAVSAPQVGEPRHWKISKNRWCTCVRSGGGRAALDEAPDRSNESVHGERLLQERGGVPGRPAAENIVYLVCRDIQDGKIRPSLSQPTAELAAIHTGHDDVGDHEIDGVRRRLDNFQRFRAVPRLERAITLGP